VELDWAQEPSFSDAGADRGCHVYPARLGIFAKSDVTQEAPELGVEIEPPLAEYYGSEFTPKLPQLWWFPLFGHAEEYSGLSVGYGNPLLQRDVIFYAGQTGVEDDVSWSF